MRLRIKNLNIYGFTEKSDFQGGGVTKNQYIGGNGKLPKKGGLDDLQIYGGVWQKRGGGVLEGGVDTPMHTMEKFLE